MSTKMNNRFIKCLTLPLVLLAMTASLPPATAQTNYPTPIDNTYVLTYDSEFNGNEVPWDNTKYGTNSVFISSGNGGGQYDQDTWTQSNPMVSNGMLILPAYDRLHSANPSAPYAPYTVPYQYQIAGVRTQLAQQYGYWEARVKMPAAGNGIWPAFWMNNWNSFPEIDVMEWLGYQPNVDNTDLHYSLTGSGSDDNEAATAHLSPPAFGTGWHVLGMLWTPTAITWYVDGIQVSQCTDSAALSHVTAPLSAILNNAVMTNSSSHWGPPADSTTVFPSYFYVDYLHIYSNAPGAVAVAPQATYGGPGDNSGAGTTNLVTNPGFESGANWSTQYGTASVVNNTAHSGTYALKISNTGGEELAVTGLLPNTNYTLTGWAKVTNSGEQIYIGVKSYGGTETNTWTSSTTYTKLTIPFTTGANSTSAVIYLYKGSGTGAAYGDDFCVN